MLISSCGSTGGGTGQASSPAPVSTTDQAATVDLVVEIRNDGQNTSYSLQCAGSTALATSKHPNAAKACELLARDSKFLDPSPDPTSQMCTQLYGGPATASVTGTIAGKAVDRDFDLKNGCGISAWTAALPLLVEQPAGT
ncbi:SSI family serine proteinase inhibitor [Arthrobacter glacialis]|uniref:Subtilisin inhibitor domain-containing protein n=1 Tax=Arthrobacter glacialis TaxID=1664 RepID=A0A2S3ZSL2_ARTGL|nr:SSI family serine proteinase inhibitor [Arthrobacter glacialis]POH72218.1 hypothetical protein CVS27_17160 [Arthrobacter glacialis]